MSHSPAQLCVRLAELQEERLLAATLREEVRRSMRYIRLVLAAEDAELREEYRPAHSPIKLRHPFTESVELYFGTGGSDRRVKSALALSFPFQRA